MSAAAAVILILVALAAWLFWSTWRDVKRDTEAWQAQKQRRPGPPPYSKHW